MAHTDDITELYDEEVDEVHGVFAGANGMPFLVLKAAAPGGVAKAERPAAAVDELPDSSFAYVEPGGKKDESGKTTPRSKRHFPYRDADGKVDLPHLRNALARAPQSPFGDKAMPALRSAADKAGVGDDVKKEADVADEPDNAEEEPVAKAPAPDAAPGDDDETDDGDLPGSPGWEAADAVNAQTAVQTLVALRSAVCALRERETLEAAVAGPEGDYDSQFALDQVDCALDCALTLLARFAVDETAEASTNFETGLDLGDVVKAGRRLSAATESALKQAMATLKAVLDGAISMAPADTKDDASGADQDQEEVVKAEDVIKSLESPEAEAVLKSAMAKAVEEELGARLKPLEDRLAAVEAQPMPGGPVLKGNAAQASAEGYAAQVQPRAGADALGAELAPVLKALESETDPRVVAQLQTEAGRIRLRRLWGG